MYIYGRYDRELKDEMIKNYLVTFNKNPYKVIRILKVLYKKYERATILNYGLDYDIKVSKSSFIQYDKINNNIGNNLQDVDIIQYYFKNDVRENKRSSNYSEEFNEYLQEDLKLFLAHNLDVSSIYADDENRSRY
ncbi:MAG: hypothetical protein IPH89_12555 [Bacteroidetes bacterium]|nr:hypothetical protein [Bacteroidota bacterium]